MTLAEAMMIVKARKAMRAIMMSVEMDNANIKLDAYLCGEVYQNSAECLLLILLGSC